MVNESVVTLIPISQVITNFQPNPVIRLTSVAIAMEPLALASEGVEPPAGSSFATVAVPSIARPCPRVTGRSRPPPAPDRPL
ncbi:hypothetical protein Aglo01_15750 [Actinokineospora globicatena]|nr:hypothetical protein Aglo01_15750 [Actinokineospora globicatena]GLW83927.1 hypothetical protein Aglo02_15670 [Actinokineospora globicatena]